MVPEPLAASVIRTSTRRRRGGRERLVLGVIGILLVLVAWELASRLGLVRAILISSPSAVAAVGWAELQRGRIWGDVWATVSVWALGFTVAAVVGVAIGLVAGRYRRAGYLADPWLNALYAFPDLALVPVFILWFGIGLTFKVFVVVLAAVFFVAVNTLAGVRSTERRFVDVARSFGAGRGRVFWTVILPGSVPFIVAGMRQGAARAIVGVVVAEFISSNRGIGYLISVSGATLNTPRLMFGIVILAILGIAVGELLRRVERRFERWRPELQPS